MQLSSNLIDPIGSLALTTAPGFNRVFPVERQRMSNWCWAASTVALRAYYQDSGLMPQPQLVARILNMPICATPIPNPACNKMMDFGQALHWAGHLAGTPVEGPLLPNQLAQALQSGPVGCQMLLPSIGGHAVVAVDARSDPGGNIFIRVADPSDGTLVIMPFAQLRNNFRGTGGQWIRTYFTKPS